MKRWIFIVVLILIGAVCVNTARIYRLENKYWRYCIDSDGRGYYAYLPCVFIYHSFDFEMVNKFQNEIFPEEKAPIYGPYLSDGKSRFDKCYIGEAVLLMPFFLLAYLLCFVFHQDPIGGYSFFFQESVAVAALFYMLMGLVFLRKLMKEYDISEPIILFTLAVTAMGTNLYYYTTIEPSMSHQYSFGIMAMFLYYAKRYMIHWKAKYVIWTTVAAGLLALIRPTNIICVAALPFIAGSPEVLKQFFVKVFRPKLLIVLVCILAGIESIQLIAWYAETGHPYIWSYVGEGFKFLHPHFFEELFSYRKGFFVYTPLMFIAIVGGFFTLLKGDRFGAFSYIIFFLLITYLFSSWACWYFGGSFGLRAYIDFYPVFAVGLALTLKYARTGWIRGLCIIATLLCVYITQVQTYQYSIGILPYDDIDKALYWRTFLRTDPNSPGLLAFPDSNFLSFYKGLDYPFGFEGNKPPWNINNNITTKTPHSGKFAGFICPDSMYSSVLMLPVNKLPHDSDNYAYITVWAKTNDRHSNAVIVMTIEDKDHKNYYWASQSVMSYVINLDEWQLIGWMAHMPQFKNPDDNIGIYIYGTHGTTYIDDFDVRFGSPKNKSDKDED